MQRLKEMKEAEKERTSKLRVIVEGGGCNGFKIKFDIDDDPANKDDVYGVVIA